MAEKCFCHLNGYAVKDATARKQLEEHSEILKNLSESVQLMEDKEIPEIKVQLSDLFAIVLGGSGDDSVPITFNLVNATTATTVNRIPIGRDFNSIIEAINGYQFTSVIIQQGDVTIVEETFPRVFHTNTDYDAFTISIPSVSGAITVTATTEAKETNLIKMAEEFDSTEIYNNGLGYKKPYYRSTSTANTFELIDLTSSGEYQMFATGAIPFGHVTAGTKFLLKNCEVTSNNMCTIWTFADKQLALKGYGYSNNGWPLHNTNYFKITKTEDKNTIIEVLRDLPTKGDFTPSIVGYVLLTLRHTTYNPDWEAEPPIIEVITA